MTLTVCPIGAAMRMLMLLLGLIALTETASAACSAPAASAGDMTYSSIANTMVFCDGSNWVSMAGGVSLTVNTTGGGTATPAGSANDVQFNNGTNLGADTGNFTYAAGLLKAPNISTTAITATGAGNFGTINSSGLGTLGSLIVTGGATITGQASITAISSSLVQIGTGAGAACTTALAGGLRYSSTSNTMEYCSGSAWLSLGPSATMPVSFRVTRGGTDFTTTTGTPTIISFTTKTFDTNNNFNLTTERFTPTIPGKYLVYGQAQCTDSGANACTGHIYKNGTRIATSTGMAANFSLPNTMVIVDMNGATDYLDYRVTNPTGTNINGGDAFTYFQGVLLSPQGGGTGGTANPAGSTGDVQFNTSGALDADTGGLFYDKANHRLGIGTVTPGEGLSIVSGTSGPASLSLNRQTDGFGFVLENFSNGRRLDIGYKTTTRTEGSWFGIGPALSIPFGGNLGVGNTSPSAKLDVNGTISASNIIQVGQNASATCNSSISGSLRYSTASNTMEYCDSTAWLSLGPSSTQPIAFNAKSSGGQSLGVGWTKITGWATEFDTNANFASNRYTVTVPGKYLVSANVRFAGAASAAILGTAIYKNGAVLKYSTTVQPSASQTPAEGMTAIIDAVAGDYFEVYAYTSVAQSTYNADSAAQNFSVALLSPQGSGTGASGVSAMSSLTDVALTNLAGRDYLRYDSVAGKWANISESTVMSTTTMISNIPDAIVCKTGTQTTPAYLQAVIPGSNDIQYAAPVDSSGGTRYNIDYTSAGAYSSAGSGLSSFDCATNAYSLTQLYSLGRAFNFIGNANTSASTALGDRITSGTLAMTVNSATSIISLTTVNTTWGYLTAAQSFLPQLTANQVSSSNISTTYVQMSSATTIMPCNSGAAGTMRYTSGTMQVCDGNNWGNIGIGVPTGTIAAFAATSCPNGWSEYTAARGRFLRGIDNGASVDPSGTRAPGNMQTDTLQNITGGFNGTGRVFFTSTGGAFSAVTDANGPLRANNATGSANGLAFDASLVARTSTETRPVNVAVIFCQYQGYQSQLATGLATLASLSDVSVAGALSGSVLSYNGSSWIAGTGGAAAAGATNDVQFKSGTALAADTGNFTYTSSTGVLKAPTVSATYHYGQYGSITTLYNPGTFSGNTAALNSVSSSNVSATYVQMNSATTVMACSSGAVGTMRYTSGTMQVCDGNNWGNIGIGVPTGTIAAFAATSCPSGWSEYTTARGRFLRGIDNGAGVDPAGTRAPGNPQADAFQGHGHGSGQTYLRYVGTGGNVNITATPGNSAGLAGPEADINTGHGAPRVADETRPVNVAVTFCQYNGYQSLAIGVATLASLSDVSAASPSNGNVLTYSSGTWTSSPAIIGPLGIKTRQGTSFGGSSSNSFNINWNSSNAQLWIDTTNVGNITLSSDRRLKKDIRTLQGDTGLALIERMNPVSFHWKDSGAGTNMQYGFIAQEMRTVMPEVVLNTGMKTKTTPDGLLRIEYNSLFAPIVKSIQEIASLSETFRHTLVTWFASAENGIHDFYVAHLHAVDVHAKEICVGRAGDETCLTKAQVADFLKAKAANDNAIRELKAANDNLARRLDALEKKASAW